MKILFIEPAFGLSGDMLLAGLIDLGFDKTVLEKEIEKLIDEKIFIEVKENKSNGFTGKSINIQFEERGKRDFKQIYDLIKRSKLPKFVKEKTMLAFECLANIEGKIHNIRPKTVHFHELSGIDTIIDIVGYFLAIETLNISKIYVSSIPLGKGFINSAHGIMPNPAFATLELLKGFSVYGIDIDKENITPTSAVLLKISSEHNLFPNCKLDQIGYGIGHYKFNNYPNLVRLSLGSLDSDVATDEVVSITFNVDDITAEDLGYLAEKVMNRGALDISFCPVFMKKGRPAYEVNILVTPFNFNGFLDIIFSETTTLGVRYTKLNRFVLKRDVKRVKTKFGLVRIKEAKYRDKLRIKPEYEDLKTIALKNGLSLQEVREIVVRDIEKINK